MDGESSHGGRNRDWTKEKPAKSRGKGADRDGFASAAVQFTDVVVVPARAHHMAGRSMDRTERGWCAPTPILLAYSGARQCDAGRGSMRAFFLSFRGLSSVSDDV
jgi:hypothetical protein